MVVTWWLHGFVRQVVGGYKGAANLANTLKCCLVFGACAATACVLCTFVSIWTETPEAGFILTIVLIAVTLVFGGAVIPAATGVIVSSVATDLRPLSSAVSMFSFQQLGYALSPLVSSIVGQLAAFNGTEYLQ